MKPASILAAGKIPALVLACMLITACSTTQKSGSGVETQDAAPISEATQSQSAPAAGGAEAPTVQSGASSTSPDAESLPGAQSSAAAPGKGDEEAARLQKQLADQEAEINRLREEQIRAQQLAEEEAARQRAAEESAAAAAAAAPQGGEQGGGSQGAPQSGVPGAPASAPSEPSAGGTTAQAGEETPTEPVTRSIYFEFDNATIAAEYDSVILAHAAFLKANPDFKVEVQGNCDERGSREYNLALGARRAEAVKRGLELAGVDGSRIKTVSFGAEKPVAFGKDEESYRLNRRADILY